MALGAALATGKPAAYSVVPGPGFLNSTRGARHRLFDRRARAGADRPDPEPRDRKGHGQLHEIPDQIGILRRLTKWAERAKKPQHAPDVSARVPSCDRVARGRSGWNYRPTCRRRAPRSSCLTFAPRTRSAARRGRDRARRRPAGESGMSGDLRWRRRARGRRRGARAGRTPRRAGRRLSPRTGVLDERHPLAMRCRAAMRSGPRPMSWSRWAHGCSSSSRPGALTTSSR